MTQIRNLPSVNVLKVQAKKLRSELARSGHEVSHSKALELLAQQHGLRDWNTLCALAGNRLKLQPGDRVRGRYLGQPFTANLLGLTLGADGRRRVTLHLEDPVDVVRFDSFSSFRLRVSGQISEDGISPQRTSDGEPQLVIESVVAG